jgi:hypothetical protein
MGVGQCFNALRYSVTELVSTQKGPASIMRSGAFY